MDDPHSDPNPSTASTANHLAPSTCSKSHRPSSCSSSSGSSGSNSSFAFLNHSQDTFPNNLPPTVDNKLLARQRRRRTSPDDQAILEAEFQRDPKPSKADRNRIVERVTLGEREVQIWFQNRRQNSRRKSKPLDLNDLRSHLVRSESSPGRLNTDVAASTLSLSHSFSSAESNNQDAASKDHQLPDLDSLSTVKTSSSQPAQNYDEESNESSTTGRSEKTAALPASDCDAEGQRVLRRTASQFRLSQASDGSARLVGADEASPSPPRAQPVPPMPFSAKRGLRRSYSEAGFGEAPLRRIPSGRSRDSRAWEFWCDSETRTGLLRKADQETTGSAGDAIRLMRTNSRAPLAPNFNKRNTRLDHASPRRARIDDLSKPKRAFGRAQSSAAVFACGADKISVLSTDADEKPRDGKRSSEYQVGSPHSESDKENKEPGSQNSATLINRAAQIKVARKARAVLGESRTVPSISSSLGTFLDRMNSKTHDVADSKRDLRGAFDPEADGEILSFMKGGRHQSAIARDDDMDCIQGLLSLSQGNWK